MAILDFTRGDNTVIADGKPHPPLMENVVDFSISNGSSSDVATMLDVPKGVWVVCVALEILTAEGGTLTVDVGDGVDPDGYIDGVDMNATVGDFYTSVVPHLFVNETGDVVTPSGNDETDFGIIGGKFYTTADTIDILINDNADTAVMRITAELKDMQGQMTFGIAKN